MSDSVIGELGFSYDGCGELFRSAQEALEHNAAEHQYKLQRKD